MDKNNAGILADNVVQNLAELAFNVLMAEQNGEPLNSDEVQAIGNYFTACLNKLNGNK